MLKKILIISAVVICSTQLFSQEKWKVTYVDTTTFKSYNFFKISLMEEQVTKYLISKKDDLVLDQGQYVKILEGNYMDISLTPLEPGFTLEMSNSQEPQSMKMGDWYITRNDTVTVDMFTSDDVKGQYYKTK